MAEATYPIPDEIRVECDIIRLDNNAKKGFIPLNPEFLPVLQHLKEAEFAIYFLCGWEMVEYIKPRNFSAERVAKLLGMVKASQGAWRICLKKDQFPRYEKIIRHYFGARIKKAMEAEERIGADVAKRYIDAVVASQYVVRGCVDQEAGLRVLNMANALVADETPAKKVVSTLCRLVTADPTLYDHQALTAVFAAAIARQMAFSKREAKLCVQAALLHDMERLCAQTFKAATPGKIAEGAAEELRVASTAGLPFHESAIDVIRHHRERFQGQGFPHGLAGRWEEDSKNGISKFARATGLACTLAELMIRRVEGQPLGLKRSLAILNKAGTTHFDPLMVQALIGDFLIKKTDHAA